MTKNGQLTEPRTGLLECLSSRCLIDALARFAVPAGKLPGPVSIPHQNPVIPLPEKDEHRIEPGEPLPVEMNFDSINNIDDWTPVSR
ncbi:MAG: hypothetical protein WCA46_25345 [Actinocatenispora sp.]